MTSPLNALHMKASVSCKIQVCNYYRPLTFHLHYL